MQRRGRVKGQSKLRFNAIRSKEPLDLGDLLYTEVVVRGQYSRYRRFLHQKVLELIRKGNVMTYDLVPIDKETVKIGLYARDDNVIRDILEDLVEQPESEFRVQRRSLGFAAIENFFDLLVLEAISEIRKKLLADRKDIVKRTMLSLDNDGIHAVLFVDYKTVSKDTLADILLRKAGLKSFAETEEDRQKLLDIANTYINKSVLAISGDGHFTNGKIAKIVPKSISEYYVSNKSLYELWLERYNSSTIVKEFMQRPPHKLEYPVFEVNLGYRSYAFPPSALRPYELVQPQGPSTRYKEIERILTEVKKRLEQIYSRVSGNSINFEWLEVTVGDVKYGIRPNFYTREDPRWLRDATVEIAFKDRRGLEVRSKASPAYSLEKGELIPYSGSVTAGVVLFYPSTFSTEEITMFVEALKKRFEKLNLGNLDFVEKYEYHYDEGHVLRSLTSLEELLESTLSKISNKEAVVMAIIPDDERFYKAVKEISSKHSFHSQLVTIDKVKEFVQRGPQKMTSFSTLTNLAGGIYAEYQIQKKVNEGNVAGPLTWLLAEPADGKNGSMYVGIDVSRKGSVEGVAFVLFDSRGSLMGAQSIKLQSESIKLKNYYEILRRIISTAKKRSMKRIVILRDGIPRGSELYDFKKALETVREEIYDVDVDYVSVIKSANVRMFVVGQRNIFNPYQGTYAYMYKTQHSGFKAHEVAVVASKPELGIGGTVEPIVLRIYEVDKAYEIIDVKKIAKEYLDLTRLDFWNLVTGASKLALPIKLADILSYLRSMGVDVKV